MSVLTATAAKGQPYVEGTTALLTTHDNASDNIVAGSYSHNPLEGSATEADEWTSILLYLIQISKNGSVAIPVYNTSGGTLIAGPVRITGYNVANSAFVIVAADAAANTAANMLLLASLTNNTAGVAYLGGTFTSAISTLAAAVGDNVYLAAGGGTTLAAPTGADQVVQVIGQVQTIANPGVVSGYVRAPIKFGTSWIQPLAITATKLASTGTNKVPLVTDGAGGVIQNTAPTTADTLADIMAAASGTTKKALVIQTKASQTANSFEIQNSSGVAQFAISPGSATASGVNDTNLGVNAGAALTSGSNNVNVGVSAGQALSSGSFNTNVGSGAGTALVGGGNNTAIGFQSLLAAAGTNDKQNVAIGSGAGAAVNGSATGANTIVGYLAAPTLTTGASNVIVGAGADVNAAATANAIVIGGATAVKGAATSITISTQAVNTGVSNDLVIESGDVGLRRVAAKVLKPTDGAGTGAWIQNTAGRVRLATQYDATQLNTTLQNVAGMTMNLIAGRTYSFYMTFQVLANATGGAKMDLGGGGATFTAEIINWKGRDTSTGAFVTGGRLTGTSAHSTLGVSWTTNVNVEVEVTGTFTVNAGGTFIPRIAQSVSNASTTSLLVGSYMWLEDMP